MKTLFILIILAFIGTINAQASIDVNKLANAIYKAEGGSKTKHPYGILAKYKHTTPRQACINTINRKLKNYKGSDKNFIKHLGKTYCPVGALNDPWGLNKNWVNNVTKFYFNQ